VQFQRSGLSQRVFAERIGLSPNTLASWIARERREGGAPGALVPVDPPAAPPPGAIELEVEGAFLRIPCGLPIEEWRTIREIWGR